MAERFAGQTAIITGANREIRLATPERLVTEGAKVVITGRKPDALTAAVAALGGAALKVARSVVEVNVLSALSWVQKIDTAWMRRHGGAIANVASLGGIRPDAGVAVHGVSKALALELSPPPVRVDAGAPAVVKTEFAAALYEGREDDVAAEYPLGRLGTPDDIGSVVAFLLSADAACMTGRTLIADGGFASAGGA